MRVYPWTCWDVGVLIVVPVNIVIRFGNYLAELLRILLL